MRKPRLVLLFFGAVVFAGCGYILERMGNPKADFLYFDVENKVIHCNNKDGGISVIDVFFYNDSTKKRIELIDRRKFDPKAHTLDISKELAKVDPSAFAKDKFYVQIWDTSPVIYDYGIYMLPKDWTREKIQGTYNAR